MNITYTEYTPTLYDDVFRTLMNDCIGLLIPIINEVFGKNYSGNEKIVFHPNEHFINQQDGNGQKRITDSSFSIISADNTENKYIFECQSSSDDTMLIRIFEYITQEALDSGTIEHYQLTVTIPNAAVLFLRSNKNTPDAMNIVINTPGGSVSFSVPVMKVKSYSIEQLFEKNLLFLLPFYIFNLEKDFPKYDNDTKELESLKNIYIYFMNKLEMAVKNGNISAYYRRTILDMSKKVLENIAIKYKNLKKGMFIEGEELGRSETLNAAIAFMQSQGITNDQINSFRASLLKNS